VELFGFLTANEMLPILVFVFIMIGTFLGLNAISSRNSHAEDRLERIGRPKSLTDLEVNAFESRQNFAGLRKAFSNLGSAMEQNELEKNTLKVDLANAGFRGENAVAVFQGLRIATLLLFLAPAVLFFGLRYGVTLKSVQWIVIFAGFGFFIPKWTLSWLKWTRQQEIFLTLPDALDLLVVCVESGLGLDAAMRKVTDEMKGHAKVICAELALANLQLQMGRPRREVLHDLGVRTGVDDVKALAAILIQADRFGASIAQALRVQSDSMRTRRKQIAEEKAAKTAVKLIFPLVLFIFPAVFVVLVGPAAILIKRNLLDREMAG
jgi:tight adherence protein C